MSNKNKISPNAGDFVTAVKWHSHNDNSYIGDVMEVLAIDGDMLLLRRDSDTFTISQTRLEIKILSLEFVSQWTKAKIKNCKPDQGCTSNCVKINNGVNGMFREYVKKNVAEMRQVTELDIYRFNEYARLVNGADPQIIIGNVIVSISQKDRGEGSPKVGDMIARNPESHNDLWLVAKKYFNENFKLK